MTTIFNQLDEAILILQDGHTNFVNLGLKQFMYTYFDKEHVDQLLDIEKMMKE